MSIRGIKRAKGLYPYQFKNELAAFNNMYTVTLFTLIFIADALVKSSAS